jgi:hypothetical protein
MLVVADYQVLLVDLMVAELVVQIQRPAHLEVALLMCVQEEQVSPTG